MYAGIKRPKCNIVEVSATCNDPENLIYSCKNIACGKYHKIYKEDDLRYAIYFMESSRVKNIFQTMKIEDIEKIRMHEKSTATILQYVLYSLGSISGQRNIPTLDNIWSDSFVSPFYKNKSLEKLKCKKYLELLDVICQFVPHFINEIMFTSLNGKANYDVIDVLNNYYQKDTDDKCYICFGSYSNELVDNICNCKTSKVHVGCLIKTVKELGDKCLLCNKSINARIDSRKRIFFPFSNMYWSPLMSNMIIIPKEDFAESLIFATIYLVTDRVDQLLKSITDEEFFKFKHNFKNVPKGAKYYINFKLSDDNYLIMTPYPTTNMSHEKYPKEHNEINNLLKSRELNAKKQTNQLNINDIEI